MTTSGDLLLLVPAWLDDLGLDPYAFRLLAHMARRAGRGGECFESVPNMARHCRMGQTRAGRALRDLLRAGLVRFHARRRGRCNVYLVRGTPSPREGVGPAPTTSPREGDHLATRGQRISQ